MKTAGVFHPAFKVWWAIQHMSPGPAAPLLIVTWYLEKRTRDDLFGFN